MATHWIRHCSGLSLIFFSASNAALQSVRTLRALTKEDNDAMRVWQVAGGSVSNEPVGWKLLRLDEATGANLTTERCLAPRHGYKRGDRAMERIMAQS